MSKDLFKYYFKRENNRRRRIDFCKTYRMEEIVEEKDFNKKWNNPKLRWIFHKNYNLTDAFLKSLAMRIMNKSNLVLVFSGKPNSGKSEGGQSVAFKWVKYFKAIYNNLPRIHIAFSVANFDKILPKMKIGDIAIRDESPKLSGQGAYNLKAQLDNVTKIVRKKQISFVFVSPEVIKAKVVNYYLEACGKCYERRETRFVVYNSDLVPLGHVILKLHSNNKFREEYEKIKDENIDKLLHRRGIETGSIDGDQLEQDAKRLMKFAKPYETSAKSNLEPLLTLYNTEMGKKNKPENQIIGDTNYIKQVISLASLSLKANSLQAKSFIAKAQNKNEVKLKDEVVFENGMDFSSFVFANLKGKESIIGMCIARGESNRTIEQSYPEFTAYQINKIGKKLRSLHKTDKGLGYLFERFIALKYYNIPLKYIDKACKGEKKDKNGNSYPDIYYYNKLASVKLRFDTTKTLKFSQRKDFHPEFTYANKKNMKYDLIFFNPVWDNKIRVYEINHKKEDEVVVKKEDTSKKIKN
jgi:hypothetical protein